MPEMDIKFPSGTSIVKLAQFSKEILELPEKKKFRVGTGNVSFYTPTALIFLAKACRQRSQLYRKEKISYYGLSELGYANNLGFSDALNLKGRPYKQGAFGGQNYIPISNMHLRRLEESCVDNGTVLGDEIEKRCGHLADVVSQGKGEHFKHALQRSFCEIIRNCFEHGDGTAVHFCAQHWPAKREVEICIVDRGIGVKKSLLTGKYNLPKDDTEALMYSLMPGVSSKAWRHKKKKAVQKSVWDNAGYGLFFAHQLFGNLGHFFIASGKSALLLNKDKFRTLDCNVQGTIVSMKISLSDEASIEKEIKNIGELASKVKERLGVKSLDIKSVENFLISNSI